MTRSSAAEFPAIGGYEGLIRKRAGGTQNRSGSFDHGSCRRLKLPVRDYLAEVLPGLADRPIQCLPDITPAAGSPSNHDLGNSL
jgi:hypothetical protein